MKKKAVRDNRHLALALVIVAVFALIGGGIVHTALASPARPPVSAENNPSPVRIVRHGSHLTIESSDLARLERQGFVVEDIYTALNLHERTGVSIEAWLAARKSGKSWEEAIRELTSGPLKRPPVNAAASRELTTEEVKEFMIAGYSGADVIAAGELVYHYGGDPLVFLQLRQEGKEWSELSKVEEEKWLKSPERAVSQISFSADKTHTPGGLSREEVIKLHSLGYPLNDVMVADRLTGIWGLDLLELVKSLDKETTLEAAVLAHYQRLTPAEKAAALQNRRIETPVTPDEYLTKPLGYVPIQPDEEQLAAAYSAVKGQALSEVRSLRATGKTWRELTGISYERFAHALGTAQGWGLADQALVLHALLIGLKVEDAYQAALLTAGTRLTATEILRYKTLDNTWREVIEEIMPERTIPSVPENSQPGDVKPPPKLPLQGGSQ